MNSERITKTIAEIRPPNDPELETQVRARLASLTKPPGSLGKLEDFALRYCLIRGAALPRLERKAMFVFCADHGITDEGISAYPPEVTRQMARNFVDGGAAISVLCRQFAIEPVIVDIGVRGETGAGVVAEKIAEGTKNFAREPAMTREQAERAIETGIRLATNAQEFDAFGAGEMGIGNTTAAAALLSAFTGLDPVETAGRGAGLNDDGVIRKANVIRRALSLHRPNPDDPIGVLASVGGFEIGAITGLILGAAASRRPVVADGFISCSAALIAQALAPASLEYLFFAHRSAERGHHSMLKALSAAPMLDLEMRLGEGSGAALGIGLLEAAVKLYREMATFQEAGVANC